jgi:hypothetical protein
MKTKAGLGGVVMVALVTAAALVLVGCASNVGSGPALDTSDWSPPSETVDTSPETSTPFASPPSRDSRVGSRSGKTRKKVHTGVFAFFEDVELGELKDEDDAKIHDVSRRRAGVRMSVGSDQVQGYFGVFYEEFGDNVFEDSFDGGGVGGGVRGIPRLATLSDNVTLILPFRAGIDVVYGKSEIDVEVVPTPPAPSVYGTVDVDMVYFGFSGDVGIGVDVYGFQPSVGFALDGLFGTMKIDDTVGQYLIDDDFRFDGFNAGGFAELRYKHPDFPVFASVRGLFGNIDGFAVSLGVDF